MSIKTELDNLKLDDVYSLILFSLYKIRDIPEYSSLSELAYILDKKNLINLIEYFGGTTITIPTIEELELIIHALLIYKYVHIDNATFDDAMNSIRINDKDSLIKTYVKISEILDKYNFNNE